MTTRYITTACLALTFFMNAQEPGGGSTDPFDFLENKDKIVEVPQSPEVAAFEKYGNLPVNFYAGAPEISIPVFTHKGKEMSLPISLTYDATGIKVEQIATNVGLGWNLNFGGVVSREVKHLPDDLYEFIPHDGGYYGHELISDTWTRNVINTIRNENITTLFNNYNQFSSQAVAEKMSDLYKKYKEDKIDLQPDEFNFNVNGLSGKVFINYDNNTAYCVTDPNIKASFTTVNNNNSYYINSWTIIDVTGTIYTFEAFELTKNYIKEDNPSSWADQFREYTRVYTSSWFLTKIVSPNQLDEYTFQYSTPVYWEDHYRVRNTEHTAVAKKISTDTYHVSSNFAYENKYQIKQFHLSQIKYDTTTIFSTETAFRDDLISAANGVKMKRYTKFKSHNSLGSVVQNMELQQSYFKNQPSQTTNDWENARLKLDGILIYNAGISDPKKYAFEYEYENNIPLISSNAVDFWGYYNGANGNQHQIAKTINLNTTGYNFANRNPNFYYAKTGVLNSIIYPTGGKTTFNYEEHKGFGANSNAVNGVVGGLRIFKQESETMDNNDTQKITKLYYYDDANNLPNPASIPSSYTPSAKIHQELFFSETTDYDTHGDPSDPYATDNFTIYFLSQNHYMQAPNAIAYTHVSEIELLNGSLNGFTVYEFYNDYLDIYPVQDVPFINNKPSNGKQKRVAVYDKTKNLQKESLNFYTNKEEGNGAYVNGNGITFLQASNILGGDKGCPKLGNSYFYITLLSPTGVCSTTGSGIYYGKPYNYYQIRRYNYVSFYWAKQESSIEKIYYYGNATPVATTTTNTYNNYRFISDVNKTLSNDETTTTSVFYPQDLINQGEPDNANLLQLVNRNSISSPVKVLNYKNGIITGSQRKYFINQGTLPSKISSSKSNLALEDKVLFHQYDTYGNPVRISYADAPQKYYIWGYNHQLLLGQIENWPQNPSSEIQNKIAQIISLSNNPITTTQQLINEFALLRGMAGLINAEVTSFTHRPGIGVSTVTDAKGDTIYYYYDDNNRLAYVKDKDGKYLAEHEYNFRINP